VDAYRQIVARNYLAATGKSLADGDWPKDQAILVASSEVSIPPAAPASSNSTSKSGNTSTPAGSSKKPEQIKPMTCQLAGKHTDQSDGPHQTLDCLCSRADRFTGSVACMHSSS
jgi:hypothetical protein